MWKNRLVVTKLLNINKSHKGWNLCPFFESWHCFLFTIGCFCMPTKLNNWSVSVQLYKYPKATFQNTAQTYQKTFWTLPIILVICYSVLINIERTLLWPKRTNCTLILIFPLFNNAGPITAQAGLLNFCADKWDLKGNLELELEGKWQSLESRNVDGTIPQAFLTEVRQLELV